MMSVGPWELELLHKDKGITKVSWDKATTTATTTALVSAPSAGRLVIHAIKATGSAAATIVITDGTAAATNEYYRRYFVNAGWAIDEGVRIATEETTALYLHTTSGIGNHQFDVYYSVERTSGTR